MNDPELSDHQRAFVKKYLTKQLSELPAGVRERINTEIVTEDGKRIKNSHSKQASGFSLSGLTKRSLDYNMAEAGADILGRGGGSGTKKELHERIEAGKEAFGEAEGIDFILSDGFEGVNHVMSDAFAATDGALPSSYRYAYSKDDDGYAALKASAGILESNFKDDITVEQLFQDEQATDFVKISYRVKNTAKKINEGGAQFIRGFKNVRKSSLPQSAQELFSIQRYEYDARQGDRAKVVNLGTNVYDSTHPVSLGTTEKYGAGNYSPIFNKDAILSEAERIKEEYGQHGQEMLTALADFRAGAYQFDLVPDSESGTYVMQIKRGDTIVDKILTQDQVLTKEGRKAMWVDPRPHIEGAFAHYLLNKLEPTAAEAKALSANL